MICTKYFVLIILVKVNGQIIDLIEHLIKDKIRNIHTTHYDKRGTLMILIILDKKRIRFM